MYNMGDEVVLTTTIYVVISHVSPKIKARYVSPLCITQEISPVAYELDLPSGWKNHLIIHVSKLKRYICSEEFLWEVVPPSVVLKGHTLEYKVEGIL